MERFQRDISMKFDKMENNEILIRTSMVDCFHDIVLKVVVNCDNMAIKDLKVEFSKAPSPDCFKVQEQLTLLIGTPISRGLTKKLFQVLGGNKGCTNLRNMLLCSLPIALNFKIAEGLNDEEELLEEIHDKLTGTCVGYAKPLEK